MNFGNYPKISACSLRAIQLAKSTNLEYLLPVCAIVVTSDKIVSSGANIGLCYETKIIG